MTKTILRGRMWWLWVVWLRVASSCQFTLREPKGVITTPNFPHPYPVPIRCQWIIEAPDDKVIAIYFTQFYMREGLRAAQYALFTPNVKLEKKDFGTISSEVEPYYLVSNKPVMVLDFEVHDPANIHMRVREYLLDVFGFNITYEFMHRNESLRKDPCLQSHCSFMGNCYASQEFDKYYCSCFAKHFGDNCQFDSECGPSSSKKCQNGATCRYYIGSTIRYCECPPDYIGARCEVKNSSIPIEADCTDSSCDGSCSSDKSSDEGCTSRTKEERMVRYVALVKVTNPKVSPILADKKKLDTFKKDMEGALFLLFKDRMEVKNITVLELRSDSVMKFHLLGKPSDDEEFRSTLEQMLELGKLGIFDFDHEYQELHAEPALRVVRMEGEKMPVVEGSVLTLACTIEGSEDLKVEWFKDGVPILVHATQRGMWTAIVPKNSQGQYTALLSFDRVASLDSGVFYCRVSDWGFVTNRSLLVVVQSAPLLQLTPLTATVRQGSRVVVTCHTQDDVYLPTVGRFGYTWLKNGSILNPSAEPEMVEDLYPTGSRILLPRATASTTYSCIITNTAGSTKRTSVITVLQKDRPVPVCQVEDYSDIRWTMTAANFVNIQTCPSIYTGDARRKCSLDASGRNAVWEEPDFSGCFSTHFMNIKRRVDSLKLGYLSGNAGTLLNKLSNHLASKKRLQYSEGEPIVDLLDDIQMITHMNRRNKTWPTFLNITSALLYSPKLIRKQSKFIRLHELIFQYGHQYAGRANDSKIESFDEPMLAVELRKVTQDEKEPLSLQMQRFAPDTISSNDSISKYTWVSNAVELNLSSLVLGHKSEDNSSASIVVVFYKNLSAHLPQRYFTRTGIADFEYQLISNLVAVGINGIENNGDIVVKVTITNFNHSITDKRIGWNLSCAVANFSMGEVDFTTEGCRLIWTSGNLTLCQCNQIGTYALLLSHYILPEGKHAEVGFDAIAGSGCAICAFLVLLTILMLLSVWRKVRGAIVALKIQVCVALLGASGIFFCGLDRSLSKDFYPYTVSLIQFFLLTAFSLQLCLTLAVYIESVDLKNVHYSFFKISALGWAIPVIIIGATLAAQSIEGYSLQGWWLTSGSNFFYAYIASVILLTMFQILLFLIVKTEIRNYRKVADFLQTKKARYSDNRVKLLNRSILLTSSLLLLSTTSIVYVNSDNIMYEYFFAASSVLVGLVVFFSYTFCSEKYLLCCSQEIQEDISEEDSDSRARTDSFKSFLKPEIVDDPYSRKIHIDAEKRAERIKRMYTQIEKASLSDAMNPHHSGGGDATATTELLSPRHYHHTPSEDPVYKPYHHPGVASPPPQERDAFCELLEKGDGYPRMHWRYATHPHIVYGASPGKRKPGGTFQPAPQTIKVDVVDVTPLETCGDAGLDEGCFLQHTDSMETVVHCDAALAEAPLRTVGCDISTPATQTWNMTTV